MHVQLYIVNSENRVIDYFEDAGLINQELVRWMSKRLPIMDSFIVLHVINYDDTDKFIKFQNGCIDPDFIADSVRF